MRVIVYEEIEYVVLERNTDNKLSYSKEEEAIREIKKALMRQVKGMDFTEKDEEKIEEAIEIVLDISEEASGVLCYEEDTEGY